MEVGIRATRLLETQTEGGNRGARLPERGVLPGKALPPGLDPNFLNHHRHLKSHCLCRDRCSIPSGQTAYAPQLYLRYSLTKPPHRSVAAEEWVWGLALHHAWGQPGSAGCTRGLD